MKLHPQPFGMIQSGRKTIELRLYDEKRQRIHPGDTIRFVNTVDEREQIEVEVIRLHCFENFRALYKKLPLLQCGYTEQNLDTAAAEDMNAYYSPAKQKEYGVVGIEISRK